VLSSKYEQRYVHRRRKRLNADTDLFCLRGSGNQKALTANARLIKYFCALALITTLNSHQGAETIQTLAMLPELTKLKITTVQCEHLSTHLVTGDGREDAFVRPGTGSELSAMISKSLNLGLHLAI